MKKPFIMIVIIIMIMMLVPINAYAANNFTAGVLTIDTEWKPSFPTFQSQVIAFGATGATTLNITAGELTDTDVTWITNNMTSLVHLNITNQAFFTTEPDGITCILPFQAFYKLLDLETARISIDDNYQLEFLGEAFLYNSSQTSLTITNSAEFNGGVVDLYDMASLTSVSLPKTTVFAASGLGDCPEITHISLPEITSVGDTSFLRNYKMDSISLPKITNFGPRIFYGCTHAIEMTLGSTVPTIAVDSFTDYDPVNRNARVYVPATVMNTYDLDDSVADGMWYGWLIFEIPPEEEPANQVVNPQTGERRWYEKLLDWLRF